MKMIQIIRIGCGMLLVASFLQVGSSTYPPPDNGSSGNGIISAQQGRESGGIHAALNGHEQDYRALNNGSSGSGNFTKGTGAGGNLVSVSNKGAGWGGGTLVEGTGVGGHLASIYSTEAGSSSGNFSPGVRAAGWMG